MAALRFMSYTTRLNSRINPKPKIVTQKKKEDWFIMTQLRPTNDPRHRIIEIAKDLNLKYPDHLTRSDATKWLARYQAMETDFQQKKQQENQFNQPDQSLDRDL